ncbi:hyccin-like isoform X1 [Macrobrachium rosenbergii]|uniref:hyccin-like isoform X1 n=1 Tax=Macrobrachium rosenbergii TaxID=79674 RepID=UPI0034D56EC9
MDGLVGVLEDWLGDCDSADDSKQLFEYLQSDHDRLVHAIYTLCDERSRCPDLFESVVKQLFTLARSQDEQLREFVLLFAPSLLYIYLSSISLGDKKGVGSVEVALLALYNMEVLDEQGQPRISPFRLPTLARQSVFHEPASLAPASFTVDSLQRLEAGDAETVRWGPPTQMTTVTAATRHHLATAIMVAFNARLATLPKIALMHLCKAASKIVSQGFNRPGHHHRSSYGSESNFGIYPRPTPRIPVTSELLAELLHAVYFAIPAERSLHDLPLLMSVSMPLAHFHYSSHNATKGGGTQCPAMMPNCAGQCYHSPHVKLRRFNEFASLGIQSLEDIHMRAQYELFGDVLLMTNAIKNSLKVNPSGQPSDGPMGISVALTPSTTSAPLSKTIITNASFRTKKLPDDIPIQQTEDGKPLNSISEEGDGDEKISNKPIRTPQGSGRDKEKERDRDREGKEKKFVTPNIPIPNLGKRKEKSKNGDKKDGEKKGSEKKEKHKHDKEKDKENRNGTSSNRNSAVMNSDSDGNDVTIITSQQQQSQQQQFEMKAILKSPRHFETNTSAEDITPPVSEGEDFKREEEVLDHVVHPIRSPLEVNGGQNLITKM